MATDNFSYTEHGQASGSTAARVLDDLLTDLDADIPLRDADGNESNYTAHSDQLFVANDTYAVYDGDGSSFVKIRESGSATKSGDGSATTFTISHGLGETPEQVDVTPTSSAASGDIHVSNKGSSDFDVTYASAPANGTDNVTLDYIATAR